MGVSNQRRHVQSLQMMLEYAKQAMPYGLTDLNKVYQMLAELTKALGFAGAERFWTEPQPGAMPQPQEDPYVQGAKIKAQADVLTEQMKIQGNATIQTLKDESAAIRTFFQEQQESQRQAHENMLRAVSEATDRMQELRMQGMKPAAVQVTGIEGFSDAVKKATEAAKAAGEHARTAGDAAKAAQAQLAAVPPRPRKRTVKAPSGKTYTVEDQ
jgi:hypothetical protein